MANNCPLSSQYKENKPRRWSPPMHLRDFLRDCFNQIWTQKRFWYVSYMWTIIRRMLTPHSNKLRYIPNFQAWSNLLFGCSSASIWIYLEIKQDVNASKGTRLRSLINLFPGKFELFSKICWGKRQNNKFGTLVHPLIKGTISLSSPSTCYMLVFFVWQRSWWLEG